MAVLVLPVFELLKKQPKVPHVARTIASREWPNEHGVPITYKVRQSRNKRDWWISASNDMFRSSNTLHTTNTAKAAEWIAAVESGQVRVKRDNEGKSDAQISRELDEALAALRAKGKLRR